jgi:hypothetical protein
VGVLEGVDGLVGVGELLDRIQLVISPRTTISSVRGSK